MILEYLRKSRADGPDASVEEVLRKHRLALEELAGKKRIVVDAIYEEVVSGESLAVRPQMISVLECVRAGDVEAVLCMDIDRLGRGGMADQGVILDAFRESDTLIITPDKTYDLNDETDEELTEFKAFMARREYKMIRKRMRRGLMQTIQDGGYVANPPYGYRKVTLDKLPSLEIVPEEAEFVRLMYRRYLSGTGAHIIAQELNSLGSHPRRNAQWSQSTVRQCLRNPTYKGMIAWNRVKHYKPGSHGRTQHHVVYMPEDEWILVPGKHPAIIEPELWDEVQRVRKARYIPPTNNKVQSNPFAGLIYCSVCGQKLQQVHAGKTKELYLYCAKNNDCASAKLEYIEAQLLEALRDQMEQLRAAAKSQQPTDLSALRTAQESVSRELDKLEQRTGRLYDFLEDGTYDKETFRARMAAAENDKKALLQKQQDLEDQLQRAQRRDPGKIADAVANVLELYPTLDVGGKNRLLKSILVRVYYTKPKKTKPTDFTLSLTLREF